MNVAELMSTPVEYCQPSDDLCSVAVQMWDRDIGAVVVVDHDKTPIGMVTDRDICMAAYTRGCTLGEARVDSLLGRPIVSCRPDDTVADAAERMALHQVRRLPVVNGEGALVGILTLGDVARGHRMSELAGAVLAVIATPRYLAGTPSLKIIERPGKGDCAA